MLRKNVAGQFLHVAAVNATTGAALTGATISVRRCIDGTFAAAGATVTEDTGLGFYKVALTQADTNGNDIAFFFTATNMIPVQMTAITTAADPTDTVRFGLTALPNVASGSAGAVITSGTGTAQLSVASGLVTLAGVTHTGAVIPTVSAVTGLTASNLDATISSRMATYTQPTGFLAATFPTGTIANTTNITAGTITTATNLTTNNDKTGYSLLATTGLGNQTANITGNLIGTVSTLTTYTGNTPQTGDAFARLGAPAGASVSADVAAINAKTTNLPAAPASTTNITAATGVVLSGVTHTGAVIPTVSTVTNAVATTSNTKKNQALSAFEFMLTDSTNHAPKTSAASIVATRSIDGTAFAAGTLSAVTEVSNGIYKVDFGSGDLNGNVVTLRVTATACDDTFATIITQP